MSNSENTVALIEALFRVLNIAVEEGRIESFLHVLQRRPRILVLGSTGVGKTNLLESLVNTMPQAIHHMNRTDFAKSHNIKIAKQPFRFIDTPGQKLHSSRRKPAIRNAIRKPLAGILNVVSYGYHEYRLPPSKVIDRDNTVPEAFLDRHRQIEIEALGEWTHILGDPDTTGWMVTVATKADLWWNDRESAVAHYTSGPYFGALGPAKSLAPAFLEYCAVMHRFYDRVPLAGTFDDRDRVSMRARLLEFLLDAVGKERQ